METFDFSMIVTLGQLCPQDVKKKKKKKKKLSTFIL